MSENTVNELPNNWEWTELGSVITKIIGGGTPSKNKPEYWCGDIPWLTVKDMRTRRPTDAKDHISEKAVEESSTNIIPEDTVIIATRIGLGKVIRVPYKVAINQDLKAIIVPPEIDKGYLEYWFVSKTYYLESIGSGTTVKGIRLEQVRDLKFPLAPLVQQKQIVAKIEQLFSHIDAGIEALNTAKQRLKQYRQSVLKAAVTGELSKEWRERNKVSYESWSTSRIGEISLVQTGKTPKRSIEEFWTGGTIPWLTSSATNESFTHHADQFVTQAAIDAGLKLFEQGTLLLAMYGEGKTRGQVTEITFQAACNQACAAIIVDEKKAMKEYVRLRLNENYEQIRKAASGGNQPNLNLSKVREISLPLPLIAEQAEIVLQVEKKIEAIKRLENDLDIQLFKAEKNKQSILSSAFSGNL